MPFLCTFAVEIKGNLPGLGIDFFFQIVQVEPSFGFFLKLCFQLLLLKLQLPQCYVVTATFALLGLALLDCSFQIRNVLVDGGKFPLFPEGEFQLLLPGPLRLGLRLFFPDESLGFLPLCGPVALVSGIVPDLAVAPDLKYGFCQLIQEEPVVGYDQDRPGEALQVILQNGQGHDV